MVDEKEKSTSSAVEEDAADSVDISKEQVEQQNPDQQLQDQDVAVSDEDILETMPPSPNSQESHDDNNIEKSDDEVLDDFLDNSSSEEPIHDFVEDVFDEVSLDDDSVKDEGHEHELSGKSDASSLDDFLDDETENMVMSAPVGKNTGKATDTIDGLEFQEVDLPEEDEFSEIDDLSFGFDDLPDTDLVADIEHGTEDSLPDLVLERDKETDDLYGQGEDNTRPSHERLYLRALNVLRISEDLNVDSLAVARIKELIEEDRLPQLSVRDLINEQLIDRQQLARAIARSQNRLEIMSIQDLPDGARSLRKELDIRIQNLLRERRIIPLRKREKDAHELHLAHDSDMRDLVLESMLLEVMPGFQFVWHFAVKDVCGQFWVSGDEGADLDEGMEAEALLDRIVTTAVDAKASDIHIDPNMKGENKATVKYRVDGMVRPREVVSLDQLERLRVRIENIARMPKVNQNHPNKGAFSRAGFDWRVQIQPHSGRLGPVPRIVIRRLNPDSLSMERLGYSDEFIASIQAAASASNGVIFWTGPTGSGKTESIHSAVISANPMARGLSVHTIEDPPEKRVEGYAVQMEVAEGDSSRSGTELLKSSLRADPDVIIFGEVRDNTMAKLVFEAANTGHLVFSTLHTNTSVDAIVRLDELGIRGFLVSYVRGIAAQRLVRRLCTHCRQTMDKPDEWTQFCFDYYKVPVEGSELYRASPDGCPNCGFTGYRGRIAVAEWLVPNKEMVQATADRDFNRLEEIAIAAGWKPMGHMGIMHVKAGITDAEELGRVILELSIEVRDKDVVREKKISKSAEDVRI